MVGVKPAVLLQWITTGKFKPSVEVQGLVLERWLFTEEDIGRLLALADRKESAEKSKLQSWKREDATHYTPAQLAREWGLSVDTIRKMFESEPGVLKLGDPKPRRKRRYVTLRIPSDVALRVHRRLSAGRA